jgi:predicted nucleotidyltransferase
MLARYKESEIGDTGVTAIRCNLYERVIYRCLIGSQAYGLAGEGSDIDRRGIYLPPADLHWSLYGVPDQLENDDTQETYWEIQKFLVLALKANPNVLECLYRRGSSQPGTLERELQAGLYPRTDRAKSCRHREGPLGEGGLGTSSTGV